MDIIAASNRATAPLYLSIRALVKSVHEDSFEIVWPKLKIASYGIGPRKTIDHYVYIGLQRAHVNLGFYHGAVLPDPDKLLEGSGKNLRHVKLRSSEAVGSPALRVLVEVAGRGKIAYFSSVQSSGAML